jgi:hypothetical protein
MISASSAGSRAASAAARRARAGQVPRVVLDAVAVADLADHLEIEHRPLVQPLRLEQLALAFELRPRTTQLFLDRFDRRLRALARRTKCDFG